MSSSSHNFAGYQLLDSGEGEKLEQYGKIVVRRPSSLAIWKKRKDKSFWHKAAASFDPDRGWSVSSGHFDSWIFDTGFAQMELRLQKSGQVGIFPDHALYLDELGSIGKKLCARKNGEKLRVLNLFAFTGMATVMFARQGAHVCHVDLAKPALSWTSRNLELNKSESPADVRLICDDAIEFVKREVRRKNTYDIVIADPPSFGRVSKARSWKLEDIISEMIQNSLGLLPTEAGALYLTCHHAALGAEVLGNLLMDAAPGDGRVSSRSLFLKERETERQMPAGHLATMTFGI